MRALRTCPVAARAPQSNQHAARCRVPPARAPPAPRQPSLLRAGFDFKQSVEDGTLAWEGGGGRWSPPPPGGGEGPPGGGDWPTWPARRGFPWLATLFFMAAKSLVCWCAADPKAAATNIDLGFLLAMALLACASLAPSPLAVLRPLLVKLTVGHIVLEMAFYGFILNAIDPAADYRMSPEMWVHHAAVALGGLHTAYLLALPGTGAFAWAGTQLIITEITTFLPVAFHAAIKNKRMKGPRGVVLGVLFPAAFALRCVLSARVLGNYLALLRAYTIPGVPFWPASLACSATILGLNLLWTYKIVAGGARQVLKRRARAARATAQEEAGAGVYGEAQVVYSEAAQGAAPVSEQKRRLLR